MRELLWKPPIAIFPLRLVSVYQTYHVHEQFFSTSQSLFTLSPFTNRCIQTPGRFCEGIKTTELLTGIDDSSGTSSESVRPRSATKSRFATASTLITDCCSFREPVAATWLVMGRGKCAVMDGLVGFLSQTSASVKQVEGTHSIIHTLYEQVTGSKLLYEGTQVFRGGAIPISVMLT